ncbi:hypothetical protein BKA64DRAFT_700060 [Cadophora sp. MPI-SDFR-AT-0126]|nr:hypothetical protein BKA64DRAFT_700060 [Leotiomycetes sp. MPI-SDFR-AT-0126]
MRFSLITIFLGVLAGNVIAVATSGDSILQSRARKPAATQGKPCTGFLDGAPTSEGVCGANGLCGIDGTVSNEFVQFKSDDC